MADETTTTLTYFDGRGRGEIIRIALSFANFPVSPLKLNYIKLKSPLNLDLTELKKLQVLKGHLNVSV